MSEYVSLRVQACTHAQAARQAAHDSRKRPPSYLRKDPRQVTIFQGDKTPIRDPLTTHERLRGVLSVKAEEIKTRYRAALGQRFQGNGRAFVRGVLTFSPEPFCRPDFDLNRWAALCLKTARKAAECLGVELLAVTFHTDEKTPHAHMLMTNLREDGRTAMRRTRPADMSALQDLAGEIMKPLGFVRGIPRETTGARHLSVLESHREEQRKAERERETAANAFATILRDLGELRARVADEEGRLEEIREERKRLIRSGRAVQEDYKALARARKAEAGCLRETRKALEQARQNLQGIESLPELLRELSERAGVPEICAVLDAWGGSGPLPEAVLWECVDALGGPER